MNRSKRLYATQNESKHINLLAACDINRDVVENKIKSRTITCCVAVESHVTL